VSVKKEHRGTRKGDGARDERRDNKGKEEERDAYGGRDRYGVCLSPRLYLAQNGRENSDIGG